MLPRIIQIVKRFGPVGGMETYVWRLAHGLSERGYSVSIICEQVMAEVSREIDVIQVEKCREKRRWKSMLIFRRGWTPSYKTGSGARISSSIAMSAQYPIR